MADVQLEVGRRAPSTSTRHSVQSSTTRGRRNSSEFDNVPNTLPNFSPITSRASSSPQTERYPSSFNSSYSEHDVCRICHGGNSCEMLLSPCYCTGSVGKIHLSCLQRWLGSSNKTKCEICDFQFTLERKPKPFKQFIANPGSARDKRNILCDIVCVSLLTPLTIITAWLCMSNAVRLNLSVWECAGLFSLAACLLIIFFVWTTICFRQNYNLWKDWSQFNQDVKLTCQPPPASQQTGQRSRVRGHTQLTSVEIPIYRRQHPHGQRSLLSAENLQVRDKDTTLPQMQNEVKGERSRNQCSASPKSGSSIRSFPDSIVVKNHTVNQENFAGMRIDTAVGRSSISPGCCSSTPCNDPKCLDNEGNRRKCFSPRPKYMMEEQIAQGQRSRSPSGNKNSVLNQCTDSMSPNFIMKQESFDRISSIRSNASSGGSSVIQTLPSLAGSSSRSIELFHQGHISRSVSNHPREMSASRDQATRQGGNADYYNPSGGSKTEGYETYV
ncbi:uncharacterized protein [Argopecten irradians]|uniref:uncharacterized protein n=1 Tax=Argopecten irradians TaxID=31199 RepID=UPI00371B1514